MKLFDYGDEDDLACFKNFNFKNSSSFLLNFGHWTDNAMYAVISLCIFYVVAEMFTGVALLWAQVRACVWTVVLRLLCYSLVLF